MLTRHANTWSGCFGCGLNYAIFQSIFVIFLWTHCFLSGHLLSRKQDWFRCKQRWYSSLGPWDKTTEAFKWPRRLIEVFWLRLELCDFSKRFCHFACTGCFLSGPFLALYRVIFGASSVDTLLLAPEKRRPMSASHPDTWSRCVGCD